MHNYKNLIVWQRAKDLVFAVYRLVSQFPKEELYGLTSQIKRAAISIPSNIAEGRLRKSDKEFRHFLFNAYGSGAELETQLEIAKNLFKMNNLDYNEVDLLLIEVMKMLNKIISNLAKA